MWRSNTLLGSVDSGFEPDLDVKNASTIDSLSPKTFLLSSPRPQHHPQPHYLVLGRDSDPSKGRTINDSSGIESCWRRGIDGGTGWRGRGWGS